MVFRAKIAEVREMIRQARSESAVKGWGTRRDRTLLNSLYALEDPRELEVQYCPADSVGFLERLYALDDPRD